VTLSCVPLIYGPLSCVPLSCVSLTCPCVSASTPQSHGAAPVLRASARAFLLLRRRATAPPAVLRACARAFLLLRRRATVPPPVLRASVRLCFYVAEPRRRPCPACQCPCVPASTSQSYGATLVLRAPVVPVRLCCYIAEPWCCPCPTCPCDARASLLLHRRAMVPPRRPWRRSPAIDTSLCLKAWSSCGVR
jgi:hypothetical protein